MNFKRDIAIKRAATQMRERRIVSAAKRATAKVLIGAAVVAGALMAIGYYDGPARLVEAEYTVQDGDNLWCIAEHYMALNTAGPRYLPEFLSGLRELNPAIQHTSVIHPGQVLKVSYFVKDEAQ